MADIDDYFKAEKSQLNFESTDIHGDIGLAEWILEEVSYDTIVIDFDDITTDGYKQQGKFLMSNNNVKAWRRGRVMMVGPDVTSYKVGDLIVFPGVKGMDSGELYVRMPDSTIKHVKNGYFIAEDRVFGRVTKA